MAKLTKDVNLSGQMFMTPQGMVYMTYGEGKWFKKEIGSIASTKLYQDILRTHGTKEGKAVRERVARAIMHTILKK